MIVFAVSYLGVLLADRSLLDVTGRLESRLLVPLHVVAIVLGATLVHRLVTSTEGRPARAIVAAAVLAIVGLQVGQALSWSTDALRVGGDFRGGFDAPSLEASPALAEVGHLAPGTPVYSNAADALWFVTGRDVQPVPARRNYLTGLPQASYQPEMAGLRDAFALHGAVLVWFDTFTSRDRFLPTRRELTAGLGLVLEAADRTASTWRGPPIPRSGG